MRNTTMAHALVLATTISSLVVADPAQGESGEVRLEEVVVTAQKREERLIDVPAAINCTSFGSIPINLPI